MIIMITKLAIKREYGRVNRARKSRKKRGDYDDITLAAIQQTLAWVLADNAARPTKLLHREL